MLEPGKLLKLVNLSKKERGQLADLLDNLSCTNYFRVLEDFLGENFLLFLDIFQGDTIQVPNIQKILLRAEYLKIYNDSAVYDLDYLAKKYKKKPSIIKDIIDTVQEELEYQDGDLKND